MIYFIVCAYGLFGIKGKYSITKLLFALLLFTTFAAYLVGRTPQMEAMTQLYTIYSVLLLSILFFSYKKYKDYKGWDFSDISEKKLQKIEPILIIIGIFSVLLYAYMLSKVFSLLLMEEITVQEHKNEGGATELFDTLLPHRFITLGNLVSPLGYFFLFLHFYYLIKRNVKKSLLFFVLSLNLILNGLIALSRSSTVQFVLLYIFILFSLLPLLQKKTKKTIIRSSLIIMSLVFIALFVISSSRFSNYYTKESLNEAVIDEGSQPLLFSTLDYFGQWEENGPIVMDYFEFGEQSWGLYSCSGLANQLEKMIRGAQKVNEERDAKYTKLLKNKVSAFIGLPAAIVFDFGFFGGVIFMLLISCIIRKYEPRNSTLNSKALLTLIASLPVALVFWGGNVLVYMSLDLGIIYIILLYMFLKHRPIKLDNSNKQINR